MISFMRGFGENSGQGEGGMPDPVSVWKCMGNTENCAVMCSRMEIVL